MIGGSLDVCVCVCVLQSFSEMFVKFLEVESSTDRPPPRMPVQDMKALGAPPPGRGASSSSGDH